MSEISVFAVRALVAAVERLGVDRARFLAAAGIAESVLDDPSARVSLAAYSRVRRAALETSGDPALGLHMAGGISASKFDVLAPLAEHSGCLREALRLIARYAPIVQQGPQLDLSEDGATATICWNGLSGDLPELRLSAEFVMGSHLHLIRRFIGPDAQVRKAYFAYEAPAHVAEYTALFDGREQFSHTFTGLAIERSWLDLRDAYHSPGLCEHLQMRADFLLAKIDRQAPASQRVKQWLAFHSLQTRPTMETIARDLGMSVRSLRRRLHSERTPYTQLLEQALAARAKGLLAGPTQTVQEAAYGLGFESPAAFSRAFKRWTGMAPSVYRDTELGNQELHLAERI